MRLSKELQNKIDDTIYSLYDTDDQLQSVLDDPFNIIKKSGLKLNARELQNVVHYIDLDFDPYEEVDAEDSEPDFFRDHELIKYGETENGPDYDYNDWN